MEKTSKLILIGSLSKIDLNLLNFLNLNYSDSFIGPEIEIFSNPLFWQDFQKFKEFSIDTNLFSDKKRNNYKTLVKNGINPFFNLTDYQLSKYNIRKEDLLKCISFTLILVFFCFPYTAPELV